MKRYYATRDIAVVGVTDSKGQPKKFAAGEELVGVKEKNLLPMLRLGQAIEKDEPAPALPAGKK